MHLVLVTFERRQSLEDRRLRNVRGFVKRLVAREQCAAPLFKPRALWQSNELGMSELPAQCLQQGSVARHSSDQQHAPQPCLPLLQQRDNFTGHAIVQRLQDVRGSRFVAVELMRYVRLAMHRAA